MCLAAALVATPAAANGRFPGARQIAIGPTDPSSLLLRTTFGQMLSRDGGQSFHWVCEQVIGYGGTQDPAVAITADGSLINTAYEGTSVTHDGGCSWAFADGLASRYSVDVALDPAAPARALVVAAADASHGLPAQCWETTDSGQHWAVRSAFPAGFFPQNVDLARSRPGRVYATGLQTLSSGSTQATLLRSDDGGTTWVTRTVPTEAGRSAYLSAVDPADENLLYARVEGGDEDTLLRSADGGESWSTLISLPGGMLGFALSPDGGRIAIGGPSAGVLVASRESAASFVVRSATPVTCLAWGMEGLYACGVDELSSGFAMGRSSDEGATFAPVLAALGDTCGPLTTCAAASPYAATCPALWPGIDATLRKNTPSLACGQVGTASGGAGTSGGPGATGGTGPAVTPGDDEDGGCHAAQGGSRPVDIFPMALFLAAAHLARRSARGRHRLRQFHQRPRRAISGVNGRKTGLFVARP